MELGKYTDGRTLNYDETKQAFDIGGAAVTSSQVKAYDDAGQVEWASDAMKAWFVQSLPNLANEPVAIASAKVAKPWFKKWWVWALAVVVFAAIASGGSGDETKTASNDATRDSAATEPAESAAEPVAEAEPEPAPAPAPKKDPGYDPGMYKVGADLPAGEYVLESEGGSCYLEVTKDSTGAFESILTNDNFEYRSILTVSDGQYVKVNGARIIPVAEATPVSAVDGMLREGMYRVGVDFPAGEYKVIPSGSGYYELATNSTHMFDALITNENFETERYVTVQDGQYIKLSRASIKVQ